MNRILRTTIEYSYNQEVKSRSEEQGDIYWFDNRLPMEIARSIYNGNKFNTRRPLYRYDKSTNKWYETIYLEVPEYIVGQRGHIVENFVQSKECAIPDIELNYQRTLINNFIIEKGLDNYFIQP